MTQHHYKGIAASDGLVLAGIQLVTEDKKIQRTAGDPRQERDTLQQMIDKARAEIDALAATQDDQAAEILEFQSVLLEDDDLLQPIFQDIESGKSAHQAWVIKLDREIEEYKTGDNKYLAARAEDLKDLKLRVYHLLMGVQLDVSNLEQGKILVFEDLSPTRFLELDWTRQGGAATKSGSRTSHVSILARARGVPLIIGLEAELDELIQLQDHLAVLDAEKGELIVNPDSVLVEQVHARLAQRKQRQKLEKMALEKPATLLSGEPVTCLINVDDLAAIETFDVCHCDGIGLTRTEFLFQKGHLPSEEEQFNVYRKLLEWAEGRPVTIRTLDAGGDKPIPGVTLDHEANPFLGVRGLRLSLLRPELFRVQLRALSRASVYGHLKVMVPMVTIPQEMQRFKDLMAAVMAELTEEGIQHGQPALGMMVEVPAAAITAQSFEADFYSIGSNDLIQYVTAAARDNPHLVELADPFNPAVLSLIESVVQTAGRRQVDVSVCGDMASEPETVKRLLAAGVRILSVAPAQLGRIKLAVGQF